MTPARQPHRIYLAGSWKNQQEIILIRDILKAQGHAVDCFASEENGRISFNWSKLADIQEKLPTMDAKDMLAVPRVQEAFREDRKWIDWCDICILTLPSGKSSHLEAGYAKGTGKIMVIFGDLQKGDFDVMYGFADAIFRCDEIDQMIDFVNGCASHSSQPVVEFTAYGNCPSNTDRCPEIDCDTCRKSINSSQAVPETMPDIGRGGCLCDSCLADCIRHNVRQQEERR